MARDYRTIHRRYPEGPEDPLLAASLGRAGWFLGVGPSGDPLLPQRTICHISAPALAVTLADHQRLILPTKTLVLGFPHWLSRLRITSAAEERNGTIWLETSDGKYARITNGNGEAVNANPPGKNAIVDSGIAEEISGRWVRGTTCSDSSITRHPGAWRDFRSSHSVRIGKAISGLEPLHKGYAGYAGKGRASLAEERSWRTRADLEGCPPQPHHQTNGPLAPLGRQGGLI